MPNPPEPGIPFNSLSATRQLAHRTRAVAAYQRAGSIRGAARILEQEGAEFGSRQFITEALERAGVPYERAPYKSPGGSPVASGLNLDDLRQQFEAFLAGVAAQQGKTVEFTTPSAPPTAESRIDVVPAEFHDPEAALTALRKGPMSLEDIAKRGRVSDAEATAWLGRQRDRGVNLHEIGGKWSAEKTAIAGNRRGVTFEYVSRPDNTFVFGACGDQHMGSKYEREDVLNDLYDKFVEEGVDRAYNTGNWIDGEARFNKFDLKIHGMDQQLAYLAEHYPKRPGIETWAVAGNDHEGWYGQREGVEIGHYAEVAMHDAGREDWHHLGFIESHVRLVNANSGESSVMTVMHPGGGSAYAVSYQPQKIVESLDGGEKPAVLLLGHYHKLSINNIRNVWTVQTGCCQDQTPFMKGKRIDAHVGGLVIRMRQDPRTGAIVRFQPEMFRYFNRGYYAGRWSHSGDVVLPERITR